MTAPKVLVAGIGNIFLGDDGFGCAVARLLAERRLGADVRVIDFGIRGLDLVYVLLDDWEMVIFVDAVPRGEPPSTLYVLSPNCPTAKLPITPPASRRRCSMPTRWIPFACSGWPPRSEPSFASYGWSAASRRRWRKKMCKRD